MDIVKGMACIIVMMLKELQNAQCSQMMIKKTVIFFFLFSFFIQCQRQVLLKIPICASILSILLRTQKQMS